MIKVKDILKDCSIWMPNKNYEPSIVPLVSVLLPTFRRAKNGFFERAVQSVLDQTFKDFELIIIDDCSIDGTFELIKHFMRIDKRVNCIRHTFNVGLPAISEYEGYVKSRGDYIAFIFDDNEWQKCFLAQTISLMIRESVKASYGCINSISENAQVIQLGNPNQQLNELSVTNFIGNSSVILHKIVLEQIGLYDPHLVMTRLCDWDLWRRIIKKFEFKGTGILVGTEYGASLNDSLGNTYTLNVWSTWERMNMDRRDELIPSNFENIEIDQSLPKSSNYFRQNISIAIEQYKNKIWFKHKNNIAKNNIAKNNIAKNNIAKNNIAKNNIAKNNIAKNNHNELIRILVLTDAITASTSLSFERLIDKNSNFIFRLATINTITLNELVLSSCVIIFRGIVIYNNYIDALVLLHIPCYYYVDDNFIELAKDYINIKYITDMAGLTTYDSLKRFKGIFVSSCGLLSYFKRNQLHDNLIQLNPVIDSTNSNCFTPPQKNKLVVAFMGGPFREAIFKSIVIPALRRISKTTAITICCPSNILTYIHTVDHNFTIIEIPRVLSLDQAILAYKKYSINILIHPGPDIPNNQYKTENSLFNAVQIGAVLFTSNLPPYRDRKTKKNCYILVENYERAWYIALKNYIESPEKMKVIYNNALEYCLTNYSPQNAIDTLTKAFSDLEPISYVQILARYDELYQSLFYKGQSLLFTSNIISTSTLADKPTRPIKKNIGLSLLTKSLIQYFIQCRVDNWSELGICFASFGECNGNIKITIYDENKQKIREINMSMNSYTRDTWTYLKFTPLENSHSRIFCLTFEPVYSQGSSKIGVWEDLSKRNYTFRALRKLGFQPHTADVLFTDCRS